MSCRDKQVIAWTSFEIGDGSLYTEDDVKKICPTPSSLGLVVHESGFYKYTTMLSIHPFFYVKYVQTYEEWISIC
jgi:hypothetical protein